MTEKHCCSFQNKHLLLAVILSAGSSFLKHVTWVLLKYIALWCLYLSNTFHNMYFSSFYFIPEAMFPYRVGVLCFSFPLEGKKSLTKTGGEGTNLNHEWRHIWKKILLWNENTGSVNSREPIYPQVIIIITVTKFRRLVFPSKTSAECYKWKLGKNHLSLEKCRHR